jgi:transcriptional regulator with GAF, ATPase, and Fis domain
LVGASPVIAELQEFVGTVAPTSETVLVFGETGTGKEVVARQIHAQSNRAEQPFVAMNAACVPRELFESELFGHKRGAFTGAQNDRAGLFREADGGTLFIDELAELPLESQAKLLRAIETKTIRPVGESGETEVDVRIVAATNRDLWAETQAGRFREDLYFRLQVFPVLIRPLRERPEDVAPLATHLLARLGKHDLSLDPESVAALQKYDWPGNVRELLNVLRRASLFAISDTIGADLIRRMIAASVFGNARDSTPPQASGQTGRTSLADVERDHIERVLRETSGNITKAAASLGIDRRTLQRKLRGYGIDAQ